MQDALLWPTLHWKKGGHKALCQQIKSGGGAEQYHADKKYKEAVAVAVEACAEDTKGQTCYISAKRRVSTKRRGLATLRRAWCTIWAGSKRRDGATARAK